MKQFDFEVQSPVGSMRVRLYCWWRRRKTYQSKNNSGKGISESECKNMISLLTLRAHQHEVVTFIIDGADEEKGRRGIERILYS